MRGCSIFMLLCLSLHWIVLFASSIVCGDYSFVRSSCCCYACGEWSVTDNRYHKWCLANRSLIRLIQNKNSRTFHHPNSQQLEPLAAGHRCTVGAHGVQPLPWRSKRDLPTCRSCCEPCSSPRRSRSSEAWRCRWEPSTHRWGRWARAASMDSNFVKKYHNISLYFMYVIVNLWIVS